MSIEHVASAVTQWRTNVKRYGMYRDYYDGNHSLKFMTPNFREKFGHIIMRLRENLCPAAVTAFTDSLSVQSWGDGALAEAEEQGLSRLMGMVTRETYRCGDAFVLVWNGADGTPKPHYHRADQIVPHVDSVDTDRLDWAAKPWVNTAKHGRVNLYYPDRVERWVTSSPLAVDRDSRVTADLFPEGVNGWVPYSDEDGGPEIRHDFGVVPVCWWKLDADDQSGYGKSILTEVVPLQDALNKSVADMVVTSEAYSRPFWYLLNFRNEPKLNPETGKLEPPAKFDPTKSQIVTHDGPGPFGQLDPPDLTRLLKIQDGFAVKVARVIGAPSYYFTQTSGDVPSGESLKVLSSRKTAAVQAFQRDSQPVNRGLMQLLGHDVEPAWAPAVIQSEAEKLANAQIMVDLGVPLEKVFEYLGYEDPQDLARLADAERASRSALSARSFAEGNLFGA